MATVSLISRLRLPFLPFTVRCPASSCTSTPLGTVTGFFPTLDMAQPVRFLCSEYSAKHFAADSGLASCAIRHHPLAGGDDGHSQPGPNGWQRALSAVRSEEHTSELQSRGHLVCR